jgi:phospholipid/cholesterol/gamma-HCH transport system ATP-binding protein
MKTFKVEMQDIHKSFGSKHVLRGVNLEVKQGESLVIIGGSGTGKSVAIKTILGLIKSDSGKILIDGKDISKASGKERDEMLGKCSMLFQAGALFDSMSVWENVAFGLTQGQKMPKKKAYPIAIEKLKAVGLNEDIAQQYPAELSGGMQKRVSLARAIATNPDIIFFDEPTTGLDPIMADVINNLIRKTVKELGATAISITHDMASVRKIADSVAMIYEGKIIWHGPIEKLENSGNEYVDQFIHGKEDGPIQF